MIKREFSWYRNLILGALAVTVACDVGMLAYSLRADLSTVSPQKKLSALAEKRKMLQADIIRARSIQKEMPKTKADCILFEGSLPPANTGYSVASAELAELGKQAGLQVGAVAFKEKDLPGRGMSEITIDATVEGNYKSVVRFLNGLQRSSNNYVVDGLALASDTSQQSTAGMVKVTLHLTSYFKAGA